MSHTREPFRASINEHPAIRIRFSDREGRQQQTTISSTHVLGYLTVSPFQAIGSPEASRDQARRDSLLTMLYQIHEEMDCTIHGIERVGVEVHEF